MTVIYHQKDADLRHRHAGIYISLPNHFELPPGPFPSRDQARNWIHQNADRLSELYGPDATTITEDRLAP
jgi:hypothetical protein